MNELDKIYWDMEEANRKTALWFHIFLFSAGFTTAWWIVIILHALGVPGF